jgi:hypothetical protein
MNECLQMLLEYTPVSYSKPLMGLLYECFLRHIWTSTRKDHPTLTTSPLFHSFLYFHIPERDGLTAGTVIARLLHYVFPPWRSHGNKKSLWPHMPP